MKNLNKLGLILGVGGMSALVFSLSACSDDPAPGPTAGSSTGGSAAGSTSGGGGAGGASGGSSSGSGGGGGMGGAKAGAGGGGAGGASGGGGAGGASGGGGAGGASGGTGGGGAGGAGGAAPSADCSKWCSGANGVIMKCVGMLPADIDTEQKCLAECATAPGASLTCWNQHLTNIVNGQPAADHCGHATGADGNGVCPEL